ncbi:MAG TPA: cytidylate kinase-like family protein [Pyrinomonadaceae bacterium]|jgi:cytidylate kinase|nr:cytidylate kinase-like family protein [Pyrinomonadaceae bacterium]
MTKTTITISRQMGAGGSYIGQVIATHLGFKYVDREVLHLAAQEFGCDDEAVASRAERVSSFWERILGGLTFGAADAHYNPPPLRTFSDEELFQKQTEILRRIASKHDCVVIGWAGLYVLPRHPAMFNIFCHAPMKFRIRRVMEIYKDLDRAKAGALIKDSDDMRERYFAEMTNHEWTCANNYHLSIDTSLLPLEETAQLILLMMKTRGLVQ